MRDDRDDRCGTLVHATRCTGPTQPTNPILHAHPHTPICACCLSALATAGLASAALMPAAAAKALGDFCYLLVPADMLLCLYRAIQLLHTSAARAASVEPQVHP